MSKQNTNAHQGTASHRSRAKKKQLLQRLRRREDSAFMRSSVELWRMSW